MTSHWTGTTHTKASKHLLRYKQQNKDRNCLMFRSFILLYERCMTIFENTPLPKGAQHMEKMTSIMTTTLGQTKTISKLKINSEQPDNKNILKAISFMQRKLTDEDLSDVTLLRKAIHALLGVKGKLVRVPKTDRINDEWKNTTFDCSMRDLTDTNNPKTLYFDMTGSLTLSQNGSRYSWRDKKQSAFTVYNGKRLLAAYLLWEKPTAHMSHTDELNDLDTYFVNNYFIKRQYFRLDARKDTRILNMIMDTLQVDLNSDLMDKYENDTKKEVATALQTKKYINKNIQDAMTKSKFLKHGFKFVEYDNDTDLDKIARLETEWKTTKEQLPRPTDTPDLRFRKLGKHKAWGLYSAFHNAICIDIRNVNSFIHEYGHFLDFKLHASNLSMQADFQPIIKSYRNEIHKQLGNDSYVIKKLNYYLTPTEVFARAYELYMRERLTNSSFLKDDDAYNELDEYKTFTPENKQRIKTFMRRHIEQVNR